MDILTYCFHEDEDNYLLKQVLQYLNKKYKKLIILDSIFDSIQFKKEDYFKLLNQLLQLNYGNSDESKVLIFKESMFQIRTASNEEIQAYIEKDSKSQNKKKKKNKKHFGKNSNAKKEENDIPIIQQHTSNELISPNNQASQRSIPNNIDIAYLFNQNLIIKDRLEKVENELAETKNKLAEINNELAELKNEMVETKNKFQIMKKSQDDLKMEVGSLKLELKKIKIRSLYKGIIDIFCSVYGSDLKDNYYNKLNNLLCEMETLTENNKTKELKEFLIDVYEYLQRGDCLAKPIEENSTPLEMFFPLMEKEGKKNYSNTKNILLKLSFNEILKDSLNNFYSIKNKKNLIEVINFDKKDLEEQLL